MDTQQLKQARLDKKLLSNVSKMPGYSISRSAWLCDVGSRLAEIEGSTCENCYARKGMYHMPNVKAKMIEREAFFNAPDFVPRMVNVLNIVRSEWFRWFDSGDVGSVGMALNIIDVCRQTPHKRHWIPSREFKVWTRALQIDRLPNNAVLRMSAHMVDGPRPKAWPTTSTVHSGKKTLGRTCPAPEQQGKCGDCRACWSLDISNVSYHIH
tara:strand:+ start:5245 stop:5874 length:630 start_codon:yes stop_codon:yes gene_type:complete